MAAPKHIEPVDPHVKRWTIIILCALLLVRLLGLGQQLADDEGLNVLAADGEPYGSMFHLVPHPPTVVFIYSLGDTSGAT